MGDSPRKGDERRFFAAEFNRGVVQHIVKGETTPPPQFLIAKFPGLCLATTLVVSGGDCVLDLGPLRRQVRHD